MSSEFDQLIVTQTADLDGQLRLGLVDLGGGTFDPEVGDAWKIVRATNVNGEFFGGIDDTFAPLPSGTFWDLIYGPTSVILQVIAAYTADFDNDGDVDGDDFLVWQAGFQNRWRLSS